MRNALIVFETGLQYNRAFISYLRREIEGHVGALDTIEFVDKGDDDIVALLEEISAAHKYLMVVTSESFSFVGKIIATLCRDSLVLREGMLVPMKSERIDENSYLVRKGNTQINVMKIDVGRKLPSILVEGVEKSFAFYLLDLALAEKIEGQITQLEMCFEKVYMIEGVWFYRVRGVHPSQYAALQETVENDFGMQTLIGEDFSEIVCRLLMQGQSTITAAESCTGGLFASEVVRHSGVSAIFAGSIVSYANEVKMGELGVRASTLKTYGAVSQECVHEMLHGVLEKFDADYAVAISGVAGPTGGTAAKPVGTVYVGAKCRGKEQVIRRLSLKGDRTYIREQSVFWAFRLLLETNRAFFFKKIAKTLDK